MGLKMVKKFVEGHIFWVSLCTLIQVPLGTYERLLDKIFSVLFRVTG